MSHACFEPKNSVVNLNHKMQFHAFQKIYEASTD